MENKVRTVQLVMQSSRRRQAEISKHKKIKREPFTHEQPQHNVPPAARFAVVGFGTLLDVATTPAVASLLELHPMVR